MSGTFVNQTFDDRDTTNLRYAGGWPFPNDGSWNASNVGQSGTLSSTKDMTANVTFTFPIPAKAIYYYGIPRCCGGLYAICVDCDPNNPVFETIDAVNRTDDGKNPPIVLWSKTFDTPGIHEIILTNQNDTRFNNSQITIDRFDLEVINNAGVVTTTQSGSAASTPTSSISPSSTAAPQGATEASTSVPTGAIVGAVIGSLAVLAALLLVLWLYRRRRKRPPFDVEPRPQDPTSSTPFSQFTVPSTMYTSTYTSSYPSTPALGYGTHKHMPSMSTSDPGSASSPSASASSSRLIPSSVSYPAPPVPRLPRRETDAGQIHEEDFDVDSGTLPPDYDQVFRRSRNPRSINTAVEPMPTLQSASSGVLDPSPSAAAPSSKKF